MVQPVALKRPRGGWWQGEAVARSPASLGALVCGAPFFSACSVPTVALSFHSIVWESCLPWLPVRPRKGQAGRPGPSSKGTFSCLGQLDGFLSSGYPAKPGLCFADALSSAQVGFAECPNRALGPKSFGTSQDQFAAS